MKNKRRDLLLLGMGGLAGWLVPKAVQRVFHPAEARSNNLTYSQTGLALDIGYAQAMLVHHQQALVLSSLITQKEGTPDRIDKLASRIQNAQTREIQQFKGWLIGKEAPMLPTGRDLMQWMRSVETKLNINEKLYLSRCASSPMGMSGLASNTEIQHLMDTSIPRQIKTTHYMKLMIRHHEGAIGMSTLPAREGATRYIRIMASEIIQDQSREILLMQDWLKESVSTSQS